MTTSQLIQDITPDEQFNWSAEQLAKELPSFQLKGAGWYCQLGTWMLVLIDETSNTYTLLVFYNRDPRAEYRVLADAPVRQTDIGTAAKTVPHTGSPTVELIILLVGGVLLFPLSFWLHHHIGNWSILAMLGVGVLFGQVVKYLSNKGK